MPDVSSYLPWGAPREMRRDDRVMVAIAGAAALCAVLDIARFGFASALDYVVYLAIGSAAVAQAARAARAATGASRRAWMLIAAGFGLRLVGGLAWSWAADRERPIFPALGLTALAVVGAGLVAFPRARLAGRDARRAWLDMATVIVGSALVVWFLSLGPYLRAIGETGARFDSDLYTFAHSVLIMVTGVVALRTSSVASRLAASWLLTSFVVRLVPDLLLWFSPGEPDLAPFHTIAISWDLSWWLVWAAARAAERAEARAPAPIARHESGSIPLAFLLGALLVLVVQLVHGGTEVALLAIGSATLTVLLVARQGVELDERDELVARVTREGERFRALLLHAYDAVAILGRDGSALFVSPATERLFGAELTRRPADQLLELVHPEDRPRARRAFARQGAGLQALRLRIRDVRGQYRTFEGHLHDQRDDPRIAGVVLHGIDRSREDRLAEGLEATQPLEALGILAGGLAHDVNNILTVVASHAELLGDDAHVPAASRADVTAIAAASDRARLLTAGLLTLSRRKEGAAGLIAVPEFVAARAEGLPLDIAPTETPLHVWAAAEALTQVVDAVLEVAAQEARGRPIGVRLDERDLEDAEADAMLLEPRRYVAVSVGTGAAAGIESVMEAVRTVTGDEWDLAPGDLALLIALAACRELGGTLVRERHRDGHRLVLLLPAAYQ
ncbi:MAG: PAS domain-containing protein [Gemmatimonadaceae bacterium]|nr:PAS domain-containing protein [Gemmatimonadaceae bacterium]